MRQRSMDKTRRERAAAKKRKESRCTETSIDRESGSSQIEREPDRTGGHLSLCIYIVVYMYIELYCCTTAQDLVSVYT